MGAWAFAVVDPARNAIPIAAITATDFNMIFPLSNTCG
jgi:hypothetical protein